MIYKIFDSRELANGQFIFQIEAEYNGIYDSDVIEFCGDHYVSMLTCEIYEPLYNKNFNLIGFTNSII